MKTALLAALLLFAGPSFAQVVMQPPPPASVPFKKANAVVIQTTDSANAALTTVAKLLVQRGYIVDQLNKELGTVTTKARTLSGGWSPEVIISGVVQPGGIRLTSQYVVHAGAMVVTNTGEFTGMEGANNKRVFREAEAVAKQYPGAKVAYTVLP